MRVVVTNGDLHGKNPYLRLLRQALLANDVALCAPGEVPADRVDLVHLHWPEHAYMSRSRWRARLRSLLRDRNPIPAMIDDLPVVWTVHNATPHSGGALHFDRARFSREVIGRLDAWVALSSAGIPEVLAQFPELTDVTCEVVAHHSYVELTGPRRHHHDGDVIHFGQQRDNKGIGRLVAAWEAARPSAELLIVGEQRGRPRRDDGAISARSIRSRPEYVADQELADLVEKSCLAALPFTGGLNSGSVMFALSCATPVLVPATPTFTELAERVGPSWMRLFDTDGFEPSVLSEAIGWAREPRPGPPDLGFCEIASVASAHADLYGRVCASTW